MLSMYASYRSLLQDHDWYYEYSDDHNIYTRGETERSDLRRMQEKIDEDFSIWNEYAPKEFKRNKQ